MDFEGQSGRFQERYVQYEQAYLKKLDAASDLNPDLCVHEDVRAFQTVCRLFRHRAYVTSPHALVRSVCRAMLRAPAEYECSPVQTLLAATNATQSESELHRRLGLS